MISKRLRATLIGFGLPLGCALVGLCAGVAIGLEVASAHVESAPKDVGHGPAYVALGLCILISKAGLFVGAVSGGSISGLVFVGPFYTQLGNRMTPCLVLARFDFWLLRSEVAPVRLHG